MVSRKYVPIPKPDELSLKNPADVQWRSSLWNFVASIIRHIGVEQVGMCHRAICFMSDVKALGAE